MRTAINGKKLIEEVDAETEALAHRIFLNGGTLVNVAYSAAKAGLIVATKVLAKELAPAQITVNCIAAGTIDTPFIDDYDEARRELLLSLIPLGRLGVADDVAGAALYFASEQAGWVTGATLDVNGGQVVR